MRLFGQDGPMLNASLQFVRGAGLALVVMAGLMLVAPGVALACRDEPVSYTHLTLPTNREV